MHFLILTQYFPPEIGAAQVRLAAMVRELMCAGHSVEIVTALPNYPQGKIFADYQGKFIQSSAWEGAPIHRVWLYAATGAGMKRLFNYLSFSITALIGLWRVRRKPDYIFVESPPLFLGITAYLAAKWWHVPYIFNVADLWPDSVKALGLMKNQWMLGIAARLEAWLYRKARYVNAITDGIQHILLTEKALPAHKVLYLPNGMDTATFCPQVVDEHYRARLELPRDKQLFLYAGTHGYAHGMEVILATARLLENEPVLFLLVGGGSEKAGLEILAQQMNLKNVLFWHPQPPEEIARLYSLALAGISTLRDSPLFESTRPAKILANMACGKPVLYSGAGEGARLVEQAQAGIVTPPQDAQALAHAVRQLMAEPLYAAQLGTNGHRYIQDHLQWSQLIQQWLQILQDRETTL